MVFFVMERRIIRVIFLSKRGLELKYKEVDTDKNVGGLPNKSRYKYKQIRDVAAKFF